MEIHVIFVNVDGCQMGSMEQLRKDRFLQILFIYFYLDVVFWPLRTVSTIFSASAEGFQSQR